MSDASETISIDQPQPRAHHRSVSQLKKVSKCGEQYRLEKFSDPRPPQKPAAWLALGIALHGTFQDWEKGGRLWSKQEVVNRFESYYTLSIEELEEEQPDFSLWMKPPNTKTVAASIDSYRKRGVEKDVPWYYDRCISSGWEVAEINGSKALEVPFEVDLGGVSVQGYIDRVQWWPSEKYYTIEDTKTGSPEHDDYDPRQLKLYQLAIQETLDVPIQYGRYWFTKIDRGSKWFDLSLIDVLTVVDQYATLDEVIERKLFLPNPGKHCGLCSVKNICSVGRIT